MYWLIEEYSFQQLKSMLYLFGLRTCYGFQMYSDDVAANLKPKRSWQYLIIMEFVHTKLKPSCVMGTRIRVFMNTLVPLFEQEEHDGII